MSRFFQTVSQQIRRLVEHFSYGITTLLSSSPRSALTRKLVLSQGFEMLLRPSNIVSGIENLELRVPNWESDYALRAFKRRVPNPPWKAIDVLSRTSK
jgi:hypothetical protein